MARPTSSTSSTRTKNPKGSGDRLRTDLLAAANEVLDRTADPAAVTIRGVAAAVGVAPNAVYLHFANRAALLDAMVEDRFAAFADHLRAAGMAGGDDPLERLRRGHAAYVAYALAHPGHYQLLFGGVGSTAARSTGAAAFQLLVESCRGVIDAGIVGEVDPWALAASIWAFEHGYVVLVQTQVGFLPGPDEALDALLAAMMR